MMYIEKENSCSSFWALKHAHILSSHRAVWWQRADEWLTKLWHENLGSVAVSYCCCRQKIFHFCPLRAKTTFFGINAFRLQARLCQLQLFISGLSVFYKTGKEKGGQVKACVSRLQLSCCLRMSKADSSFFIHVRCWESFCTWFIYECKKSKVC